MALVCLLVACTSLAPAVAAADGTGTVSGTITQAGGAALPGTCVTATPSSGGSPIVSDPVDPTGAYTLTLPADTYSLVAAPCAGSPTAYQASSPTTLTVNAGDDILNTDFTLLPDPGTLSGTVSDPGGNALSGMCVTATPTLGLAQTSDPSDGTGRYSLSLAPGDYSVVAAPCSGNAYQASTAVSETILPGTPTPQDFTLQPTPGTVGGTISDTNGPLSGMCVTATPTTGSPVTSDPSDATGHYSLSLAPGAYNLVAAPCSGNAYQASSATPVTIDAGKDSVPTDFTLVHNPGSLAGTVTDQSTGKPVANVCVTATLGSTTSKATTDSAGHYSLTGLAAGTYAETVAPCTGSAYVTTAISPSPAVAWGETNTVDVQLVPTPPPPAPPSSPTPTATSSSAPSSTLNHYSADTTPVVGTLRMLTGLRQGLSPIRLRLSKTNARRLARRGWLKAPFTWTVAGRLRVYATATKVVRDRHGRRHRRTVTVLDGSHYRATGGSGVVGIAVTTAGHKLLRNGHRVTLTLTAIFTPADGDASVAAQAHTALRHG